MRVKRLCLVVWLFAAAASRADLSQDLAALQSLLATRGLPVENGGTHQAVLDAYVRALDPEARWVSAEEAAAQTAELSPDNPCAVSANTGDVAHAAAVPAAPTLAVEPWPRGLWYVRVRGLCAGTGDEITRVRREAETTGRAAGLILDLRGAGGACVKSVDLLAGWFLPAGTPLYDILDMTGGVVESHAAIADGRPGCPVMLLVDAQTRGTAELLAHLCKSAPGVMVLGERTRGDGRLREYLPVAPTQSLWIATRHVSLSRGPAEAPDVEPDIVVSANPAPGADADSLNVPTHGKPADDRIRADQALLTRVGHDPVTRRAVDILLGLRALREPVHQEAPGADSAH